MLQADIQKKTISKKKNKKTSVEIVKNISRTTFYIFPEDHNLMNVLFCKCVRSSIWKW